MPAAPLPPASSPAPHPDDLRHMRHALALARQSLGLTPPNPAVGCVLVSPAGDVIGEGRTQQAGGPHAEVMALRDAQSRGAATAGATAYVTLEPCAHHGRTPPCCDALVAAGIGRVVAALQDPNPRVAGQGLARLRAAGIAVDCGLLADESEAINPGFLKRMRTGLPWVRMKVAASLDGRTALPDGRSQWITGEAARADGHAWRLRACAVLTGIGTVLDDDPRLDVRLVPHQRQPHRVIVDSRLQTPLAARILPPPGAVWLYTAVDAQAADAPAGLREHASALQAAGADIRRLAAPHGKVDLSALLADLAARGVNEVHVEAGHKLNGSFWREGLVDELLLYLAPRLIGDGRELAALGTLPDLAATPRLRFTGVSPVGEDLRILARPLR